MTRPVLILTVFAVLLVPATAQARTPQLHLSRTVVSHLHKGSVIRTNVYPADGGGGLPYPPIQCASYIDGIGMVWGGVMWSCECRTQISCEWVQEGEDPYLPNGYVYRPPSGVSMCVF